MNMVVEKTAGSTAKVPEQVMHALLSAMESGELQVNRELPPERELAPRLGVARSSLRECLAILEYLGVVEARGNRKVVVKDSDYFRKAVALVRLSDQDMTLLDLIEYRRTMEGEILRLACQRATEQDLEALNSFLLRLKKDSGDYAADAEFHACLARASHNAYFAANFDLLSCVIADLRIRYCQLPNYYERTYESHRRMFEAVRDHDPQRGMAEVNAHMDLVQDFLRETSDAFSEPESET